MNGLQLYLCHFAKEGTMISHLVTIELCYPHKPRKIIEAAVGLEIRKLYKFHTSQLGLLKETSSETSIMGHMRNAGKLPKSVVLDFERCVRLHTKKYTYENYRVQTAYKIGADHHNVPSAVAHKNKRRPIGVYSSG